MISVIFLLVVPKVPSELTSHSVMSKTESLAPSISRLTVLERFLGKPFLAFPFLPVDWNRCVHVCVLSRFNRVWLCDPMNRSPQGSSLHGILQAEIPEWVRHALPQEISWPRDQALVSHVSCVGRRVLYTSAAISPAPSTAFAVTFNTVYCLCLLAWLRAHTLCMLGLDSWLCHLRTVCLLPLELICRQELVIAPSFYGG